MASPGYAWATRNEGSENRLHCQQDSMAHRSSVNSRDAVAPGTDGHRDALTLCLSLDLEVGRADDRIHALAGVRPDTGQTVAVPRAGRNPAQALARLDELAEGADFLLGHNLIDFDIPAPAGRQSRAATAHPARGGQAPPEPSRLPPGTPTTTW